ncbi:LPP20 family lipoprotein [Myxococcota bacterium]|nr:LPP20 family lipoprotein [Myxococcota bacterium]
MNVVRLILVCAMASSSVACLGLGGKKTAVQAPVAAKPASDAPEWVMRTPRMAGNICATGAVDPTFYRQDGRTQAADSARNELARTIQVKVSSVMYDEQTTSGSYVDQAFVSQVVGSISDVVLSGAQVMEYWYDEKGSVSRKGMTYALACMPTDQSVAQLAEKLKSASPDSDQKAIERVKERAQAAFDELEAMENKKQVSSN